MSQCYPNIGERKTPTIASDGSDEHIVNIDRKPRVIGDDDRRNMITDATSSGIDTSHMNIGVTKIWYREVLASVSAM